MNDFSLEIIVHKADEGGFWVEIPCMPGCVAQGDTIEELVVNLSESAAGWLEVACTKALQENNFEIDNRKEILLHSREERVALAAG